MTSANKKEDFLHCKECNGILIQNGHESTCMSCGMVNEDVKLVEDRMVFKNRMFYHEHELLFLKTHFEKKDIYSKYINNQGLFNRLHKRDNQYKGNEKRIYDAHHFLIIFLPHYTSIERIRYEIFKLFFKIINENHVHNSKLLLTTCIYVSFRKNKIFFILKDLLKDINDFGIHVTMRSLNKCFLEFKEYFGNDSVLNESSLLNSLISGIHLLLEDEIICRKIEKYDFKIKWYFRQLGHVSKQIFHKTIKQYESGTLGAHPLGYIGCIIYFSSRIINDKFGEHYRLRLESHQNKIMTLTDISRNFNVTEATLRSFKKKMFRGKFR